MSTCILIVEDQEEDRGVLRDLLTGFGDAGAPAIRSASRSSAHEKWCLAFGQP